MITIIHLHNLDRHGEDSGDWGGNDDVSGDIDNDHVDTTEENNEYPEIIIIYIYKFNVIEYISGEMYMFFKNG